MYFFLGPPKRGEGGKKRSEILYIGKATSLKDRVRSYFSGNVIETRGPLIEQMLRDFDDIKFQKTDSVLEALILEAKLIRQHQPPANVLGKDDRSFNHVVITDEEFPKIMIIRQREMESSFTGPIKKTFGPFTNGRQLKEALKMVRKMFPYRGNKCKPGQARPCFERQINLCPGVCTGEISQKDYAKQIKKIILFFEGDKKKLIKSLEREMRAYAKDREFEKADMVKRQIFALRHIQDVSLIKSAERMPLSAVRIESYDIAHLSETNRVGVMTVVEGGKIKKSDYRKFKIQTREMGDVAALSEVLKRRLKHNEWPSPDLIVVDGGIQQKNVMEKVLLERSLHIPVVAVVKDEKHRPREILGVNETRDARRELRNYEKQILLANAEAHRFAIAFHRRRRNKLI